MYLVGVQLFMPKDITLDSQDESRQPFAQQSRPYPERNPWQVTQGEIGELHIGFKWAIIALFIKDLTAKPHRVIRIIVACRADIL